MPQARKLIVIDKRKQTILGQFFDLDESARAKRIKLCTIEEAEYKHTTSGRKRRTDTEYENYVNKLYQDKQKELLSEKGSKASSKSIMIKDAMQLWLDEVRAYRSQNTHQIYLRLVNEYISAIGNHPLDDFKSEFGTRLKFHFDKQDISDRTKHKNISTLQSFFNWCFEKEYTRNRIRLPKPLKSKHEPIVYTREELENILAYLTEKHRQASRTSDKRRALNAYRAFLMSKETGMRGGEIWALRLENINLEARLIHIRSGQVFVNTRQNGRYEKTSTFWKIKTLQERSIPISNRLLSFIQEDLEGRAQEEIFWLDNTQGINEFSDEGNLGRSIKKACKALGINGVKPLHGVRSSVATHLLEDGFNITWVQKLLGHSRIETTKIYQNTDRLPIAEMVNAISEKF